MRIGKLLLSLLLVVGCNAATYYVAPSGGSDSNPGTYAQPFASIKKLLTYASPGNTLILKNGTYGPTHSGSVTASQANGSTTVNASGPIFNDSHNGYTIRFTNNVPPWGATISSVNSSTQVTMDRAPDSATGSVTSKPFMILPSVKVNGKNGTQAAPITLRAETDFQATLNGGGGRNSSLPTETYLTWGKALFTFENCSWWIIEGIRFVEAEGSCMAVLISPRPPSNPYGKSAFNIHRRNVYSAPNPRQNAHGLVFTYEGCVSNLVEDVIVTKIHRHPVSFYWADYNTARRVYTDHMDYRFDDRGGYTSTSTNYTAQTSVTFYDVSHCLAENVIGNGGIDINGDQGSSSAHGQNNKVIGSVFLRPVGNEGGSKAFGGMFRSRDDGLGYVTNSYFKDCVFYDSQSYGVHALQGAYNSIVDSAIVSSDLIGLEVRPEDWFWIPGSAWIDPTPGMQTLNASLFVTNTVFINNRQAYYIPTEIAGTSSDGTPYPYLGVYTIGLYNCLSWGNTLAPYVATHSTINFTRSGWVEADPGYNTAKYGKGAYLMRSPNYPTRGASILYKTVNGVLTTEPLWPWPLEAQVVIETGKGVTYESNGGLWKTLDGVYSASVSTPTVQLSLPDGASIFEGGSSIRVRISRLLDGAATTSGNLAGTWTIGGTAVNGTHYNTLTTSWQIDDGFAIEDVTITPTPTDTSTDGDLTLTLTINPSANYTVTGSPVTITRHDATFDPKVKRNPATPGSQRRRHGL